MGISWTMKCLILLINIATMKFLTESFNINDDFFKHSIQNYLCRSKIMGVHNWNVTLLGIDTHQAVGLSFGAKI